MFSTLLPTPIPVTIFCSLSILRFVLKPSPVLPESFSFLTIFIVYVFVPPSSAVTTILITLSPTDN